MAATRKLTLSKETLTELLPADLGRVVAGSGLSCNPAFCLTLCSSCASDFQACATGNCITTVINCAPTADTAC
jgi:hypothetical protein